MPLPRSGLQRAAVSRSSLCRCASRMAGLLQLAAGRVHSSASLAMHSSTRHSHQAVGGRRCCQRAGAGCAAGWTAHAVARRAALAARALGAPQLQVCASWSPFWRSAGRMPELCMHTTYFYSALSYMRVLAMSGNGTGAFPNMLLYTIELEPCGDCTHGGTTIALQASRRSSASLAMRSGTARPASTCYSAQRLTAASLSGPTWRAGSSRGAAARRSRAVAPAGSTPHAAPPQQRPCGQQHTGSCPRARLAPKHWRLKVDAHCSTLEPAWLCQTPSPPRSQPPQPLSIPWTELSGMQPWATAYRPSHESSNTWSHV